MDQKISSNSFDEHIETAYERLESLLQKAGDVASQSPVIGELLEQLSASLEELHVAAAELSAQNDQLAASQSALGEEQRRYQDLFEFAPDGYLVTDENGVIQAANQAAAALLQTPHEFLVDKPLSLFVAQCDHSAYYAQLKILAGKSGAIQKGWKLHLLPLKAQPLPVAVEASSAVDPQGKLISLRWLLRDESEHEHSVKLQQELSERLVAEEQLRSSQQMLKNTFSSLRDAFFIIDHNSVQILDCNPAAERIFGYPRQEMLGKTTAFLHVDEAALLEFRRQLDPAIDQAGFLFLPEFKMKRKSGEVFPTEHSVIPIKNEQDQIAGWVSIVRDLTERKQAAVALRLEKERAQKYLDIANVMIIALDAAGCVTLANRHTCEVLGVPEAEMIGQDWFDNFLPPEIRQTARQCIQELIQGNLATWEHFENPVLSQNGEIRQIAWHNSLLHDESGEITGILSSGMDITERLQAEAERQEAEQAYRNIFENAVVGIFQTTPSGSFLKANPAMARIYGYDSPEEMMSDFRDDLGQRAYLEPKRREQIKQTLEKEGFIHDCEVQLRRKDGRLIWTKSDARTVRDANGSVLYYEGFEEDITERKLAEEALRKTTQRLTLSQQAGHIGSFEYNLQTGEDIWSEELESLYGLAPGTYSGKYEDWLSLVHPEDRQFVEDEWKHSHETGTYTFEFRVIWPDCSLHWLQSREQLYYDSLGQPLRLVGVNMDITERKQAEQALRESEARYRSLVELSPDAIYIHSQGKYVYVNPAGLKLFGASRPEQILGTPVLDLIHPDCRPIVQERMQLSLESGQPAPLLEEKFLRLDGTSVDVEVTGQPFVYQGKPAVQVIAHDLSERKQTEAQILYQSTLLAHVNDAIIATDHDYCITSWNAKAEALYGWKAGEVLGKPVQEVLYTEISGSDVPEAMRLLNENGSWRGEAIQIRKDGSRFPIEGSTILVRDAQGQVSSIISVNRDVSERKQAEQALQISEERFRTIFETTALGVFESTPDGKILRVNQAYANMFGFDSPEACQQGIQDIAQGIYVHPNKRHEYVNYVLDHPGMAVFENEYRRRDGTTFWGSLKLQIIRDVVTQEPFLHGYVEDISERKQAEEALRMSEEKFRTFIEQATETIALVDEQARIIEWNRASEQITGFRREQVLGRPLWEVIFESMPPERRTPQHLEWAKSAILEALRTGRSPMCDQPSVVNIHKPDGTQSWLQQVIFPIRTERGFRLGYVSRDITESKKAEAALQEANGYNRSLIEASLDPLVTITPAGKIGDVNAATEAATGYSRDELIGTDFHSYFSDPEKARLGYQHVFEVGSVHDYELSIRHKDGRLTPVLYNATVYHDESGEVIGVFATARDITQRKQAEDALRDSEQRYRLLANNVRDVIWTMDNHYRFTYVSPSIFTMQGYTPDELLDKSLPEIMTPESYQTVLAAMQHRAEAISHGQMQLNLRLELQLKNKDDSLVWAEIMTQALLDPDGQPVGVLGVTRDIHTRKLAEEALAQEQHLMRSFLDNTPDAIYFKDAQSRFIRINQAEAHKLCLEDPAQAIGKTDFDFFTLEHAQTAFDEELHIIQTGEPLIDAVEEETWPDRPTTIVSSTKLPLRDESGRIIGTFGMSRDITERRQRSRELEAIVTVSSALRTAATRQEMPPVILDQLSVLLDTEAVALVMREPATGDSVLELARGEFARTFKPRLPAGEGISGHVFSTGQPYMNNDVYTDPLYAGSSGPGSLRAVVCAPLIALGNVLGALWIGCDHDIEPLEIRLTAAVADIAANAIHRSALFEQTGQRLERITALRSIDAAIGSVLDLRVTLNILLEHVASQLHVDAADILLLNQHMPILEFAAGRGFYSNAIQRTRLRLGEGVAGQAALERRQLRVVSLADSPTKYSRASLLKGETFVSQIVAPLLVKGQVKGVLEIFNRSPLSPDAEWLDYLEMLAGQAAIAIDHAELFEGLQRSNLDLVMAYDATIEGWTHAIDLRDKETEGHTLRVAQITERLARAMGIPDVDMAHLRRGALLHDIGKMGIPDAILFKPGPLTEEEWVEMRKHPVYAYQMLSGIAYLRPALDIPYRHHEKWDGSGYPDGLKGEQIPLAARLFAIVDVWDALRSDRPYRQAWSEEKTRKYILEQTGVHFDPRVVDVFLKLDFN